MQVLELLLGFGDVGVVGQAEVHLLELVVLEVVEILLVFEVLEVLEVAEVVLVVLLLVLVVGVGAALHSVFNPSVAALLLVVRTISV